MIMFLQIFLTIISVILIALVLAQPANTNGLTFSGNADTYYNKNKGNTSKGLLTKFTWLTAGLFAATMILIAVFK